MSRQIIITISRQPGCGGLEIGQRLARRLSAIYVDKKTIKKASEGLDAVIQSDKNPKAKGWFWELLCQTPILTEMDYYIPEMMSIVSDAPVHEEEEEILKTLVGNESAVVVGRGGFHRFRDHPGLIKVFLGGDTDYRIDNYRKIYNLSRKEAEELLLATDQATEKYIRRVTGKDIFDVRNFDICLNVSKMDFNRIIEIILEYIHYRFKS